MNFFSLELKKAELERANQQCVYLDKKYNESCKEYDKYGHQSAFEHTIETGILLQKVRVDKLSLEREVAYAQRQLEAAHDADGISPVLNEYTHIPFRKFTKYVNILLLAVLCVTYALCIVLVM
jgi:hypothetical protein